MAIGIPAYEQLIDILREEIISGVIPADTHLTILGVAKRFEVSQMPVREAFQRLQGEGLIKGIPHKGVRVISIDEKFVRNIYEVRGVMEGLLAARSFNRISATTINELKDINTRISKVSTEGEIDKVLSLDREFHMKIYEYSENSVALDIHNNFTSLLSRLRCKYGFGPSRLHDLIEQHHKILDVFISGNQRAVEKTIRKHREGSMEDLLAQMNTGREFRKGGNVA